MVRNFILRIPIVRALTSRVSQPLLPLATRIAPRSAAVFAGSRPFSHFPARLTSSPSSSSPRSPVDSDSPSQDLPPDATLTQRLKHLIKSYGWYALGVYVILSTLDFTVAFAAVNILGADHVSRVAVEVKGFVANLLHSRPPEPGQEEMDPASPHGGSGHEGLMAMIVLAYTIHKTLFLPVRVGLTAAITPRLVRWLRARGWAGSAGARRAAQEVREKIRNRERD